MSIDFDRLQAALAQRYALEQQLEEGGMALVYLARDVKHSRKVAVKVLMPELAATVGPERFLREIEIAAGLSHPHIVPLYDSGEAYGFLYYVMPYIEGESLRGLLDRNGALPPAEAIRLTKDVAEGLEYAHGKGVLHRDIKPANILLSEGHALITDFGVARAVGDAVSQRLTSTGFTLGSTSYMSPEQAVGERNLDGRSDLYSLGCVLYELLVGEPPFVGAARAVLMGHLNATPKPVRTRVRDVPKAVDTTLESVLAKDPADRPPTARAFIESLEGVRKATSPQARTRLRNLFVTTAAAAALVALMIPLRAWFAGSGTPAVLDPAHVAVLYFDDLSEGGELGYLADGVTESLIYALGKVDPLSVVSRNGVKPYRQLAIPLDSLARSLGTGSLVEGSIERSGERLVATIRLVDGETGTQLLSERIERSGEDLIALRDDIVQEAARLLGQQLGRNLQLEAAMVATDSDEAWQLSQQAAHLVEDADTLRWSLGDRVSAERLLARADSLLERAEAADPEWTGPPLARGWAVLRMARMSGSRSRYDEALLRQSMDHAEHVLDEHPEDPEALELRGQALNDLSWLLTIAADEREVARLRDAAEVDFRAAVEADPSRVKAWIGLADLLRVGGRFSEASLAAQSALDADPFLINAEQGILQVLSQVWLDLGEVERAEEWNDAGRQRYPALLNFAATKLVILAGWKDTPPAVDTAWQLASVLKGWRSGEMLVAGVLARAGLADSARAMADRIRPEVEQDPWASYYEANTRIQLGEPDAALALLGEFLEAMPGRKSYIANDWWWEPLRSDPRFQALVAPESP
ncbi:MAG: hypothetical protein BMS9Abin29_2613 [Gemmatimonadota bacterium]|nr:MAG: hypothetical protein BMS9Abin29_2613 [Gemmatimonadota bacterium]